MKRLPIPIFFFALGLLASCAPVPATLGATATSSIPPRTPVVQITPAPSLVLEYQDLQIIPGSYEGEFSALGILVNQSELSLHQVKLRVEPLNAEGSPLASRTVPLAMQHLEANESSPFEAEFISSEIPESLSVEVVSFEQEPVSRAKVNFEIIEAMPENSSGLVLLCLASNLNQRPVDLLEVGLLAYDRETQLQGIGTRIAGRVLLAPGEEALTLIKFETDPGEVEFVVWQDTVFSTGSRDNPFRTTHSPTLQWTAQGRPFLVASIQNQGQSASRVRANFEIKVDDELLAMSQIILPIPIPPGSSLPVVAADFEGFGDIPAEHSDGELSIDLILEPEPSPPTNADPIPLDVEIIGYEAIGSSLFLKGRLTNRTELSLEKSWILVSLFSTRGDLLAAGWKSAGRIGPGDSLELVIDLLLPDGIDPSMAEYELIAFGLRR